MVRKVDGSGAGDFAIGRSDEQPFQGEARKVKEAKKRFEGDSPQGKVLQGHTSAGFIDPSNIRGRLFHDS